MGADTSTAVLRADGRHHHGGGVSVIDGSVFPTSLGVNPCEMIYVLSECKATLLAERAATRSLEPRTAGAA